MGEAVLVNRKKLITSLANELVEPFDKLSKKTRVPKSRLIDEAVEDLLKKYEKKDGRVGHPFCLSCDRRSRGPLAQHMEQQGVLHPAVQDGS